jgi:bacterioferritin-associated ferredoxin
MIVCSCNVFSDGDVRSAITGAPQPLRMSSVYASLGCAAKCGRCARIIKSIIADTRPSVASDASRKLAQ